MPLSTCAAGFGRKSELSTTARLGSYLTPVHSLSPESQPSRCALPFRAPAEAASAVQRVAVAPAPWIWSQRWSDLLFLHWRVPARSLRHRLPPGVEVEEY